MSKNVGEFGVYFHYNANYVLTGGTLTLEFTRPDGTSFEATGGQVTAPAVDYVTTDGNGTFAANKYARYTVTAADWTVPGAYTVRLKYVGPGGTVGLHGEPASFTVNA